MNPSGVYYLCQPAKKELAGKVTHRFFSIVGHKANRLDLVMDRGKLVDRAFYAFEYDRRVLVDPETDVAVRKIVAMILTGQAGYFLKLIEGLATPPDWIGGDILFNVSPQEFQLKDLAWPIQMAITFKEWQPDLENLGEKNERFIQIKPSVMLLNEFKWLQPLIGLAVEVVAINSEKETYHISAFHMKHFFGKNTIEVPIFVCEDFLVKAE